MPSEAVFQMIDMNTENRSPEQFDIPLFLKNLPKLPGVYRFLTKAAKSYTSAKRSTSSGACPAISKKTTIRRASH